MSDIIVTGIIGLLTTALSSLVTWILTKRKYNAEVASIDIQNMSASLDFYKKLADDEKKRLDDVSLRNEELSEEVKELRKQVFALMNSVCYNLECAIRRNYMMPQNIDKPDNKQ